MLRTTIRARCTPARPAEGVERRLGPQELAEESLEGRISAQRDAPYAARTDVMKGGWVRGQNAVSGGGGGGGGNMGGNQGSS